MVSLKISIKFICLVQNPHRVKDQLKIKKQTNSQRVNQTYSQSPTGPILSEPTGPIPSDPIWSNQLKMRNGNQAQYSQSHLKNVNPVKYEQEVKYNNTVFNSIYNV